MSEEPVREPDQLSRETAFQLLGHSYRLALLECLAHYDEPLTLADAAEWVARDVEGKAVENIDEETVKRIYMSLYHSHIPRLEDYGVLRYSQAEDMVDLKDGEQLVEYLHVLDDASL